MTSRTPKHKRENAKMTNLRMLSANNTIEKLKGLAATLKLVPTAELFTSVVSSPQAHGYQHTELHGRLYEYQRRVVKELLAHPERTAPLRVAVVGCGYGPEITYLADGMELDGLLGQIHVAAYDISEAALAAARRIISRRYPELRIDYVVADIVDGTFGDRLRLFRPDMTIAHHCLEHLPGPLDKRVIQDLLHGTGSRICVSLPVDDRLTNTISLHLHEFSAADIERLGRAMEVRCCGAVRSVNLELTSRVGLIDWQREDRLAFGTRSILIETSAASIENAESLESLYFFEGLFDPGMMTGRHHRATKIGALKDRAAFALAGQWPIQIRALPIKMPDSPILLPEEFSHCAEAVRLIVAHNKAINRDYTKSYIYLNCFRGAMSATDQKQGGLSLDPHGDQLQNLRGEYPYKPDYSYIGSSTLPTIFFDQEFDIRESVAAAQRGVPVNLYEDLKAQLGENRCYSEDYCVYLLSPYVVHSAQPAVGREGEFRIFLKLAISLKRFFDNRELRINHGFDYDSWFRQKTVGYADGFLNHAHWNERFLLSDITGDHPAMRARA
jgi:SAM-dependent methyltransferase